jgi:p-hydroxybenzoate 3-monooxygenase
LLHLKGIDSVILETRNKEYVIDRVRAGVLEQFTADLMTQMGVGERLHREGMRHDCVYLSFGGKRDPVPLSELTGGKAIYVYGQNEVVKDLMQARLATGRPLHYEVSNVSVIGIDSTSPKSATNITEWTTNSLAISSRAAMASTGSAVLR